MERAIIIVVVKVDTPVLPQVEQLPRLTLMHLQNLGFVDNGLITHHFHLSLIAVLPRQWFLGQRLIS